LIQHHGDSILRLAGVQDIGSWKPLQAELVQNRRLPDGLIEARLYGQAEPIASVEPASTETRHRANTKTCSPCYRSSRA
jgi:hypothetical protein